MNPFDELNLDTSLGEYSEEDVREFFSENDFRDSVPPPPSGPPPPPSGPPRVTPPLDYGGVQQGFMPVQPAPGRTSNAAVMFSLSIDQLMQEKNDALCRRLTDSETQISLLKMNFSAFQNSVKPEEPQEKNRGEQRAFEKKLREDFEKKARDDQRALEKKLRDDFDKKARDDQRALEKKLREEASERQTAFEKKQRDDQRALEKKLREEASERQTAFEKKVREEASETAFLPEARHPDLSAATEARFATLETGLKWAKSSAQTRMDGLEFKVADLERAQKKQII